VMAGLTRARSSSRAQARGMGIICCDNARLASRGSFASFTVTRSACSPEAGLGPISRITGPIFTEAPLNRATPALGRASANNH
jgi:hypothetical protein